MATKSSSRPRTDSPHPKSCAAGSGRCEKPTADSIAHRVRSSSCRQRGGRLGNPLRHWRIPGAPLRHRRSATVAASPRRSAATDPARCLAARRTPPSPPQSPENGVRFTYRYRMVAFVENRGQRLTRTVQVGRGTQAQRPTLKFFRGSPHPVCAAIRPSVTRAAAMRASSGCPQFIRKQ